MTTVVPWLIGAAILLLVIFSLLRPILKRPAKKTAAEKPLFTQETAEELVPVKIEYTAPAPSPPKEPEIHLTKTYGSDRMVLMVRDPDWLYAYWEITATKQEEFNQNYGPSAWRSSEPVLRVYDVTGISFNGENANYYKDISINNDADSWHINVGEPNRAFCVDLGRKLADGRFVTLLRSNIVCTPRAGLSDCLDEEWMWIEGIYRYMGKWQYGLSSPTIVEQFGPEKGVIPLGISSPGFTEKHS
ncbi:DUF4912 domain-containing protein [Desulfolucanica intricata]|uniref:DUF4912 domain-containing protein n=1 Tax=Desulfolucanica intricata TaxID=1285191 RepID=UPI00082B0B00|nr:DUF4912 domain-containing protein [Desulfolucanica intricata]